jgi:hypothetical protein
MKRAAFAILLLLPAAAGCTAPSAPPAYSEARAPLFNPDGTVCRDPGTGCPLYPK